MERLIHLSQLDYSKGEIFEVIGISKQEFIEYEMKIANEYDTLALLQKLNFSPEETLMAILKVFAGAKRLSEAAKDLWLNRKKEKITVREFVETIFLLNAIPRSAFFARLLEKEKMRIDILIEILKLIQDITARYDENKITNENTIK